MVPLRRCDFVTIKAFELGPAKFAEYPPSDRPSRRPDQIRVFPFASPITHEHCPDGGARSAQNRLQGHRVARVRRQTDLRCRTRSGDDSLSKQRSAFGEDRDVEGSGEPIDDRAQPFQRLTGVARFDP